MPHATVPQVLAMMVDLEEEENWALDDDPEEEDTDRYVQNCKM